MNNIYSRRINQTPAYPDTNGWKKRHLDAIGSPQFGEYPYVTLLKGWLAYADVHKARFESEIGEDYVLGPQWEAIGDSLRGVLNGETGRLDCGTLDGLILGVMKDAGIDITNK